MDWTSFFYILGAALMVFLAFRIFKRNPESFSRQSLGKSFYTLGILALVLIIVILVCVKIVRG